MKTLLEHRCITEHYISSETRESPVLLELAHTTIVLKLLSWAPKLSLWYVRSQMRDWERAVRQGEKEAYRLTNDRFEPEQSLHFDLLCGPQLDGISLKFIRCLHRWGRNLRSRWAHGWNGSFTFCKECWFAAKCSRPTVWANGFGLFWISLSKLLFSFAQPSTVEPSRRSYRTPLLSWGNMDAVQRN